MSLAMTVTVALTASPALAQLPQTGVKVSTKVTPNKAGTKKSPRGVKVSGTVRWSTEAGFEPPVITGADVRISRGGVYNGGRYAKCSSRAIRRDGGPEENCPRKSIIGRATGVAKADTVLTRPKVVIVNGGARRAYLYTRLFHPALVQEPVPVRIKRTRGRWAYRLRITVPRNLLVVAGVPIALTKFKFAVGGKRYARKYIATTSCPRGGWRFQLRTYYRYVDGSTSSSAFSDKVPCRR